MLANVVICTSLLVAVTGFKAGIRHILLIHTPADTSVFEEVNDCLRARRDIVCIIIDDTKGATTNGSHIVRLLFREQE